MHMSCRCVSTSELSMLDCTFSNHSVGEQLSVCHSLPSYAILYDSYSALVLFKTVNPMFMRLRGLSANSPATHRFWLLSLDVFNFLLIAEKSFVSMS